MTLGLERSLTEHTKRFLFVDDTCIVLTAYAQLIAIAIQSLVAELLVKAADAAWLHT